jgi:hypothetical protein
MTTNTEPNGSVTPMPTSNRIGDLRSSWQDEWETQQVVIRFTAHFDAGEHDEMASFFAPEAVWYQARGPIHGVDELLIRMAALPADQLMRHVLTNLRTTIVSADEAIVDSYVTVYLQPGADPCRIVESFGPKNFARYRDRLRRVDGRWLIDERRVVFDLKFPHTSDPN